MDLLGIIFPRKCFGCGKFGSYVCGSCMENMGEIVQICPVCKRKSLKGYTHKRCRSESSPDRLIISLPYKGWVRKAIHTMKYKYAFDIAGSLVDSVNDRLKNIKGKYLLVPLPIHRKKFNLRGFNQCAEISKLLALRKNWKHIPDLLEKTKITKSQVGLSKKEREDNIYGSLRVNPKYEHYETISKVILLDDVWTTGTTLKEGIRILKQFGFKQVWGLVIAKPTRT